MPNNKTSTKEYHHLFSPFLSPPNKNDIDPTDYPPELTTRYKAIIKEMAMEWINQNYTLKGLKFDYYNFMCDLSDELGNTIADLTCKVLDELQHS